MIRNIFALAYDYQEGEMETQLFFATMQNKMHYAATGLTAAEIVKVRANATLPNMGLTSWKGSRVLKTDVGTAKNYLDKEEIDTLNRITVMFLDQAEFRAQRREIKEDKLGLDVIYIQAKRWQGSVGRPEVQKFVGALHGQRAKKGVFITTGAFTRDAEQYVSTIDPKVVLIDGSRLVELMIDHNLGVSTVDVYEIKKNRFGFFFEE